MNETISVQVNGISLAKMLSYTLVSQACGLNERVSSIAVNPARISEK